jgi:hypothetical protein
MGILTIRTQESTLAKVRPITVNQQRGRRGMDKTIIGYCVVQGISIDEMTQSINSKIKQGWEPVGGVAVAANRLAIGQVGCTFYQALARFGSSTPPPIPPLIATPGPTVPCPQCGAVIAVSQIQKGRNTCQSCKGEFTAE